jgi:hypothetical protein
MTILLSGDFSREAIIQPFQDQAVDLRGHIVSMRYLDSTVLLAHVDFEQRTVRGLHCQVR